MSLSYQTERDRRLKRKERNRGGRKDEGERERARGDLGNRSGRECRDKEEERDKNERENTRETQELFLFHFENNEFSRYFFAFASK